MLNLANVYWGVDHFLCSWALLKNKSELCGLDPTSSNFPLQTASENWEALVAFFTEFPQYAKNDFYVTGESYGGIYVPTLVQTILDRQSQFKINIKGTAIGNGCVSEDEGTDSLILFEYAHGLIDDTWVISNNQRGISF